ncbi:hypothetical protein SAMN04487765_0463 [Tenacibaculum sp. MAR_2010_89]|uniref:hypothetical protein n=1 Tax=Tenacibaculum sp. MAR_2010_89 TaxID=1250198 RepID=UPI00089739CA|nr:hypothetical protein [Tenacibaculum sp. MAR_2010_89]SED59879.1 hypothetical protein SAMN04487765_0463 [Tenacibaculum sp. MAR_2010_89]
MKLKKAEFENLRKRVQKISVDLMRHENKNHAKVGFPITNYRKCEIDGKPFYYTGSNIFLILVEEVLIKARKIFPKNFGNGNAVSVLHALNKTRFLCNNLKDAIRVYGNENFILVFDNENEEEENRILRIDLFRQLNKIRHKKRRYDFTGGLFHVLKHFSINNEPLSTGTDINNVETPTDVIKLIIKAFYLFSGKFDEDDSNKYTVIEPLDDKNEMCYVFYFEEVTRVFFLKTVFKRKIKI